jgi:hypothetical protein
MIFFMKKKGVTLKWGRTSETDAERSNVSFFLEKKGFFVVKRRFLRFVGSTIFLMSEQESLVAEAAHVRVILSKVMFHSMIHGASCVKYSMYRKDRCCRFYFGK